MAGKTAIIKKNESNGIEVVELNRPNFKEIANILVAIEQAGTKLY